ncbi:Phage Mu protein F like protein [compost metagenome]
MPGGVSLQDRLKKIGNISKNRAKFIARDQTAKLTGDLNQLRQADNGIEEYIWRNAGDQRVVGNPGGLYPKGNRAHGNHWEREGKTFRWDSPPSDGAPGHAPNCRCYAAPKLDLEKIKAQYV